MVFKLTFFSFTYLWERMEFTDLADTSECERPPSKLCLLSERSRSLSSGALLRSSSCYCLKLLKQFLIVLMSSTALFFSSLSWSTSELVKD